MSTGAELVTLAQQHLGEQYVLGTTVPKDNAGWRGPWDCAEFASWLVYQRSGRLYGCASNSAAPHTADAFTGYWARDANSMGERLTIQEAAETAGAFLLRVPQPGAMGHIVLSDGQGGTIEAMGSKYGVRAGKIGGRRWDYGVRVPWISCVRVAGPGVAPPPQILRMGDLGAEVEALQRRLEALGYSPGTIDAAFGPHTHAAVCAFQRATGLIVDGEVGPETRAELGM